MNITVNTALANRRRRQAIRLSLFGLAVLLGGIILNQRISMAAAYVSLVAGSVMSWVGIAVADKWVRPPRDDKALAAALRGAGTAFRLYHWVLPAEHVLAAPWGVTVLMVSKVDGTVEASGGRWRHRRSMLARLLSLGRRPLGNPRVLSELEVQNLQSALAEFDPALAEVPVDAVVVLTGRSVTLDASEPEPPAYVAADLRDWLREQKKRPRVAPALRRRLDQALDSMAEAKLAVGRKEPPGRADQGPGKAAER